MECIGCEPGYWILDCPAHKEKYEAYLSHRPVSLEAHFQQWFKIHIKEKYGQICINPENTKKEGK